MINVQTLTTGMLIEQLETSVAERTLLQYDDAPEAELKIVQTKVDNIEQELFRRLAW
jgi:hypothetical protein